MYVQLNIIGNITRDVELKEFATSKKATTGIAYTTGYGEKKRTSFIDIECWGAKAEILQKLGLKGTKMFLSGTLEMNEWTDNTGTKKTKHIMQVQDIVVLTPKDKALQAEMPFGKANEKAAQLDPFTGQALLMDFDTLPF